MPASLVGWFGVIGLASIAPKVPLLGVGTIMLGGLAYTGGTRFLVNDHRAPWSHAVWHLLVLFGTFCQYVVIVRYVLPRG